MALPTTNLELDIDPNASAFTDAGVTPAVDGNLVWQVNDQSGNGRHAVQATSGNRFTLQTDTDTGRKMLVNTVVNKRMTVAHDVDLDPGAGGHLYVFLVLKMETFATCFYVTKGQGSSNDVGWSVIFDTTIPSMTCRATTTGPDKAGSAVVTPNGHRMLVEAHYENGTLTGALNGDSFGFTAGGGGAAADDDTYGGTLSNSSAITIGTNPAGTSGMIGEVHRLAIYKTGASPMSAEALSAIRDELMTVHQIKLRAVHTPTNKTVFTSGTGYNTYRIPCMVRANDDTVLCFAQGHVDSPDDDGDIDIVLARSTDHGVNFAATQVLINTGDCNRNPSAVVDRDTGRIVLLFCRQLSSVTESEIKAGTATCSVYSMYSDDSGATWSSPVDITAQVKQESWRWYATGPGGTEQLASGRMVIPCNHSDPAYVSSNTAKSHVIYSDDGATWAIGGVINPEGTTEPTIAQLPDGSLFASIRDIPGSTVRRKSRSPNQGDSWSVAEQDSTLIDPVVHGAVYAMPDGMLVHANPADTADRIRLTIRLSVDGGRTWDYQSLVTVNFTAYSDIELLGDGTIGVFYERNSSPSVSYAFMQLVKYTVRSGLTITLPPGPKFHSNSLVAA